MIIALFLMGKKQRKVVLADRSIKADIWQIELYFRPEHEKNDEESKQEEGESEKLLFFPP